MKRTYRPGFVSHRPEHMNPKFVCLLRERGFLSHASGWWCVVCDDLVNQVTDCTWDRDARGQPSDTRWPAFDLRKQLAGWHRECAA